MRRARAAMRRIVCAVVGHRGRRFGSHSLGERTVAYNRLPIRPGEHIAWRLCERCGAIYGEAERL